MARVSSPQRAKAVREYLEVMRSEQTRTGGEEGNLSNDGGRPRRAGEKR